MESTRRELSWDGTETAAGLAVLGALSPVGSAGLAATAAAPKRTRPGFNLGFKSLRDKTHLPNLRVEGKLPPWLTGTLPRNGPALFEIGEERFSHRFDGLAMLHAFAFTGGRR